MKNSKPVIASLILIVTILATFALPRPKYQGTSVLRELSIPFEFGEWKSIDYSADVATSKDDRYNFISGAFARIYAQRDGRSLLLLILDAGNFHHPQLCYVGSGFQNTELGDTALQSGAKKITVKTFVARQPGNRNFVIMYWMVIDKHKVNWTGQKLSQLWRALFNKKQAGLMMRLDIPLIDGKVEKTVAFGQKFIAELSQNLPPEKNQWLFGR